MYENGREMNRIKCAACKTKGDVNDPAAFHIYETEGPWPIVKCLTCGAGLVVTKYTYVPPGVKCETMPPDVWAAFQRLDASEV